MAIYYLKNTSGSTVNVIDLGVSLPDQQSLVIDSNSINAYLTTDLQVAITSGNLTLSMTDIGDNGGDMNAADAIAALSITSRFDRDNPHDVTITQSVAADSGTDITTAELEELSDGSETALHIHDDRYYTETELGTSNTGTVEVHWDNITNTPTFGSLEWKEPALGNLKGMGSAGSEPASPTTGDFFLNTDDNHLYQYDGTSWVDQGAPTTGDRVVFKDGVGSNDYIYEWDGSAWNTDPVPQNNWAIVVSDDGDGKAAQYVYDSNGAPPDWIKIADVDWGSHNALADRDAPNSHPGTAISFDPTGTDLSSTDVQSALVEIAVEQGVDLDNIVFVAKNGIDVNPNVTLGTIANPYLTIQAAIDSISGNSSTNRFVVYVMPGDYNENVILNKSFVYLTGPSQGGTRITSSSGDTLTLSSTTESATGLTNISVISNSSTTSDNAIAITGNNPQLLNIDVNAPSGARTVYITGAYSQTFRHVDLRSGEFRIDAGVVDFYDSRVIEALTNVTSGTLRIHNGDLSHNGGDAIEQSGGTIYLVSAKLISGSGSKDFNQSGGTVYWGWVEYDKAKVTIGGTKYLLFDSDDLFYDNTGDTNITANNIGDVISQIDDIITNINNNASNHENDTNNPHDVTFTQAVTADSGTDILASEAETLTDGSNADLLHKHAADNITYDNSGTGLTSTDVQSVINELDDRIDAAENSLGGRIYVDKTRTDSYTSDGSISYPYKTIAAATIAASAGDSIQVSGGTYTEDFTIPDDVSIHGTGIDRTVINPVTTGGIVYGNGSSTGVVEASDLTFGELVTNIGNSGVLDMSESIIDGGSLTINTGLVEDANVNNTSGTGPAVVINPGAIGFEGDNVTITTTGDYPAIDHKDGELKLGDSTISTDSNTYHAIESTGDQVIISDSNITNAGTGGAIDADNSATAASPNIINNIIHSGDVTLGSAYTVVQDVIGGDPTGTNIILTPATQTGYDNGSSGMSSTNVQTAIDELQSQITSFEMPSGTSFPTSPAPDGGDIFYRTDLNTTFQYDASRSKWLSMTQMFLDWGSNVADGKYLNIHGATATQTGYLMPYNGTIISITAKIASGNQSKGVEIRRNNDRITPLDSFSTSSGTYSSITKNVDFTAGDYIQAFVPSAGTPAKDIVVMIVVVWRE